MALFCITNEKLEAVPCTSLGRRFARRDATIRNPDASDDAIERVEDAAKCLRKNGEPHFHELEPHTRMARAARATAKGGLSGLMFVPRPARVNVSAAVSPLPVLT